MRPRLDSDYVLRREIAKNTNVSISIVIIIILVATASILIIIVFDLSYSGFSRLL